MNLTTIKSAAFGVVVASIAMAPAQVKTGRPIVRPNVQRGNSGIEHQLKAIVDQLRHAEATMKSALPIYEGHRHMAMDITHIVIEELRAAELENRMGAKAMSMAKQKLQALKPRHEKATSKYTQAQIQESQNKMQQALQIVTAAQQAIAALPTDAAGFVGGANQGSQQAIGQINTALQIGQTLLSGGGGTSPQFHTGKRVQP